MAEEKEELVKLITIYQYRDTERIRVETSPSFEDPFSWGIILVDAMRVLADAYMRDEGATDVTPYLERIKEGIEAEYENYTSPVEFTGPAEGED